MLTSNISDQRTLFLLLGGVGAADLLHDFWAQLGDLLSLRRANDYRDGRKKRTVKKYSLEATFQKCRIVIPRHSQSFILLCCAGQENTPRHFSLR